MAIIDLNLTQFRGHRRCAIVRRKVIHGKEKKAKDIQSEFKAKAVALCKTGERSVVQVAEDLYLTKTALRRWGGQNDVDLGDGTLKAAEGTLIRVVRKQRPPGDDVVTFEHADFESPLARFAERW
jgi:transposase-like protein